MAFLLFAQQVLPGRSKRICARANRHGRVTVSFNYAPKDSVQPLHLRPQRLDLGGLCAAVPSGDGFGFGVAPRPPAALIAASPVLRTSARSGAANYAGVRPVASVARQQISLGGHSGRSLSV